MRSIFGKILLWFSGMLVLAVVSFLAISILVAPRRNEDRFGGTLALQAEGARLAYESGGKEGLAAYLTRIKTSFPGRIVVVDDHNRDLLTGEDRTDLRARAVPPGVRPPRPGELVLERAADGGRLRLLVIPERPPDLLTPLPYYAWIPLAIGLLCYLLAAHLATPARRLRDVVDRFGHGDLSARARSTRQDELGDLARAFDRMAERIERLVADERRLLQDVSHELRSPLTRLGYAIELARTSENRDQALDRIQKDVNRLAALVTDLLEVSRSDGTRPRPTGTVELAALVADVVEDCRVEADTRSCRLVLEADAPVSFTGVPELLRRAVENVLRNAIRHTPPATAVTVMVRRTSGAAVVSIRDQGPGVPEHKLKAIFRPFVRIDGDRCRETGGVGLGLAIAERAVSLHQGRIEARNAHPGLEVLLEFPLNEP